MGPKSMARSARWSDGLAGFDMSADPQAIGAAASAYTAAWRDAGRAGRPFVQSSAWFGLGPDAPETVREYAFEYLSVFGDDVARALAAMQRLTSPAALHDALRAIADHGIDEFVLAATSADVVDLQRAADVVASL
jgi:hypothetical protein